MSDTYDGDVPDVYPPPPGRPRIQDNRWEFAAAVDTMVRSGIPRAAAEVLANQAVGWPGSLARWANHFAQVRRGAKVMGS